MTRKGAGWWDYVACALLAVVPVMTHLAYHHFGFLSIDAAGLLIPPLAVGIVLGWAVQQSRGVVRNLLLVVLSLAFLDLQFDLESFLPVWVVVAGAILVVWVLWEHYTRIVTLSLLAMLAAIPFRSSLAVRVWEAPESQRRDSLLPLVPIVHIVLDEHAAPRAFPADIPEAVQARDRVRTFYRRHGFRLYEKAYSRYFWTHSSIPATLNSLTPDGIAAQVVERDPQRFLMLDNRLFRWATGRGYRVHVVQTTFLDTCSREYRFIASCRTYPANSISSLRLLPLNAPRRILLEYAFFLSVESYVVKSVRRALHRLEYRKAGEDSAGDTVIQWEADKSDAGMALQALAYLRTQVRKDLAGSFYLGHFLFPHFPYELDGACRGLPHLRERLGAGWLDGLWGNTTASRRVRWALYAGQVECLYTQLDSLLATIDSVAPPQGVTIVIHGDHGSRIVRTLPVPANAPRLTDQDLLDGFATLLAVRAPGIPAGIDTSAVAIQALVAGLITGDSLRDRTPADLTPAVFLERYGLARDRIPGHSPVWLSAPSLAR